jgi:hypothetical protein
MTLLSAPKLAISDEDAEGTTATDDSIVAASLTEAGSPKQKAVKRKSSASTKPKASGKASSAAVTKTTARSSTDQQAIFPSVSFSENVGHMGLYSNIWKPNLYSLYVPARPNTMRWWVRATRDWLSVPLRFTKARIGFSALLIE